MVQIYALRHWLEFPASRDHIKRRKQRLPLNLSSKHGGRANVCFAFTLTLQTEYPTVTQQE